MVATSYPLDPKHNATLYYRDLKTNRLDESEVDQDLSVQLLFPAPGSNHEFIRNFLKFQFMLK